MKSGNPQWLDQYLEKTATEQDPWIDGYLGSRRQGRRGLAGSRFGADACQGLTTVQSRHASIQQKQIKRLLQSKLQRALAILGHCCAMASECQRLTEEVKAERVVVCEQNIRHW